MLAFWSSLVFIGSAAFIVYVLFGYPLWLGWLCRKKARPVARRDTLKTVTIILPVRNGERWLRQKLQSIGCLRYPPDLVQVLVISDGSDDRTDEIAAESRGVELIRIPRSGKAAAINAGLRHASGEILFFTDVRQALDPESLRHLVACFADPAVGAASGELVILDSAKHEEANVGLYWKYEKWIRCRLSELDSVPGATGCIYAMRRSLAAELPPGTLLDDVYEPMAAFFRGYRVILEVKAKAFDTPVALKQEFRRKVRTLAGVFQIIGYYPRLLSPANRMWIHFASHKLGRLLLPYALMAVALSSLYLPSPARELLISGQVAFYGLALGDGWIRETWRLKRITSPIRVFVVLMGAALCAVSILFRDSQSLWPVTGVPEQAHDIGTAV